MRFDKTVASRGDAELNKKLDKLTTLLTLLIQKSHPSILADLEQTPPDKCVPDDALRAEIREANCARCGKPSGEHVDVDRFCPQSSQTFTPDYARARRWLEQTQREGNIGFLYDWLPRMLTEFAAVDSDSWNICPNGCGSMVGDDTHTRHCPICNFIGWCNRLAPPGQQTEGNGCSSSQLLPCGCRFNHCATDRTDPVFWNQFNGVVQCHMCGQTYTPAAPRVPQEEEKQP